MLFSRQGRPLSELPLFVSFWLSSPYLRVLAPHLKERYTPSFQQALPCYYVSNRPFPYRKLAFHLYYSVYCYEIRLPWQVFIQCFLVATWSIYYLEESSSLLTISLADCLCPSTWIRYHKSNPSLEPCYFRPWISLAQFLY